MEGLHKSWTMPPEAQSIDLESYILIYASRKFI